VFSFQQFFVSAPANNLLYEGFYDPVLVGFSVLVAVLAAYAALLVSQHVSQISAPAARRVWVALGGLCLGVGIWAMHFIGMLAFNLPCSTSYDTRLTVLSTVPGILACVLAVNIISRQQLGTWQLLNGGLLIGAGVGTMHYVGMAAMRINGFIRYNPSLFALSIGVAVVLACLALWLKFRLQASSARSRFGVTAISAGVLGLALSGMHYTAMLAAYFVRDDAVAPDAGLQPSLLAVIVLLTSGLIIVATVLATYVELPRLVSFKRSLRVISLLALGWIALVWLGTDNYYSKLSRQYYRQQSELARMQIDHLASSIEQNLQVLKGMPLLLAQHPQMQAGLRRFGATARPSPLALAQRQAAWRADRSLAASNRLLAQWATQLGADVIWLMNAAGDCVAASNSDTAASFVGGNFADRDYFVAARNGLRGQQYAFGRASSLPGLYYADPVLLAGQFVGAVVVKRNIANLSGWSRQLQAFLTDANDVVILASDKDWENRSLPAARVSQLSAPSRLAQYRQSDFETLRIAAWGQHPDYPAAKLVGPGPQPWLLLSKPVADGTLQVHLAYPLEELVHHDSERLWLFCLLAAAGSLLIMAASVAVVYLRESGRMQAEHRVAATAFESQQGMLITDENQSILRVNQAFTDITGFSAGDVMGKNPRLLQSGQHDAGFYATVWDSIARTGSWQGEIWSQRKNGEVFPEWLLITAAKDDSGKITHYVGTLADITERKEAEKEINNLAFFDPLTGLPNRRLLLDRLRQAMALSARTGHFGALLFIDLDNFKNLNDSRGHQVGDVLLQQVADRLKTCTRDGDTTARLGGDEFVVMLENMSFDTQEAAEQARVVGDKVLTSLNQSYQLAGSAHHSTPSIGVAMFSGQQLGIDELLKRADLAMYQAKAAGRNTLRFFDPELQAASVTRAALEDDLRNAVQKGQFVLYYQAQVVNDGRLTGAEVLLRWQHPQRGMVSPAEFIPLAEESGLILPLGQWVLQTACAQLAAWAGQERLAHLSVSVNVSARQFRQPDFVDQVVSILDISGARPQRLKLELTESMLVSDVEDIIGKMTALKEIGVGFSLDDFGTGYSSLSYLKRLPLDQLKIDQSFVKNILTDPNDASIAKMVIALAESMGLSVIAEGVELDAQRAFLARLGCRAYQGYLFGRPLPLDRFEDMM
jgi:diguanylate cyclase (GGDEF)-like protein/PAS domain S-box-containing protein